MACSRLRALARLIRIRLPTTDRAGSVAIISAVVFSVLVGFAGLAVDAAWWEDTAQRAQAAADQGALAAGMASSLSESESAAAQAVATSVSGMSGATVTTVSPPTSGPYSGVTGDIQVTVSQQATSFFSRKFLGTAPVVSATAVVSASGGACVILLGVRGNAGFTASGTGGMTLNSCDFYNYASGTGTTLSGGYSITAEDVYLSGSWLGSGGSSVTAVNPPVHENTGAPPYDPYSGRTLPTASSCTYSGAQVVTASHTYSDTGGPTEFCSGVIASGGGTLTFNSGVYIFHNSSLTLSGTWTVVTNNATLIFTGSGSITASGTHSFEFTAPTSGDTKGMAIWSVNGDSAGITLSGSSTLSITGAVYVPSGALTISGVSGSTCTQLVAAKVTSSGTSTLKHDCSGVGISDIQGLVLIQ